MTRRAETLALSPGKCRVCGCTDTAACTLLVRDGDIALATPISPLSLDLSRALPPGEEIVNCSWIDPGKTLCSNPRCIATVSTDELLEFAVDQFLPRGAGPSEKSKSSRESHGHQELSRVKKVAAR
jgi:hypothetical protein